MIFKLLIAVAAIYALWRMWHGWGPLPGTPRPAPRPPAAPHPVEDPDRAAARALLGIGADADEAAIRAAHRRLMVDAHPDRGGSADHARRLNAARDLLLRPPLR